MELNKFLKVLNEEKGITNPGKQCNDIKQFKAEMKKLLASGNFDSADKIGLLTSHLRAFNKRTDKLFNPDENKGKVTDLLLSITQSDFLKRNI